MVLTLNIPTELTKSYLANYCLIVMSGTLGEGSLSKEFFWKKSHFHGQVLSTQW